MANQKILAKGAPEGLLGQNRPGARKSQHNPFRHAQVEFDFTPAPPRRQSAQRQPREGHARKKDPILEAENLLKENRFLDSALIYFKLGKAEEAIRCAEAAGSSGYYVEAVKIHSAIGRRDLAVLLVKKVENMRLRITAWELYRELGMRAEAARLMNDGGQSSFRTRGSFSYAD